MRPAKRWLFHGVVVAWTTKIARPMGALLTHDRVNRDEAAGRPCKMGGPPTPITSSRR